MFKYMIDYSFFKGRSYKYMQYGSFLVTTNKELKTLDEARKVLLEQNTNKNLTNSAKRTVKVVGFKIKEEI